MSLPVVARRSPLWIRVDRAPRLAARGNGKLYFQSAEMAERAETSIGPSSASRTFRAACSFSVGADGRLAPTGESRHIRGMDWSDEGIVLSTRPHGESGLVASLLTRDHGRHAGFVPGGESRRGRPMWHPGNLVEIEWRARLSEQLGNYAGELREPHAARALD